MTNPRVLNVKCPGNGGDKNVLIYLTSNGQNPLDLNIVGSEGAFPYTCSFKHNDAIALRDKRNKGTNEEWLSSLSWILLGTRPVMKLSKFVDSVEVLALAVEETKIELNFRHNISGITQKLGTITLKRNDDLLIEFFEWTTLACRSATEAGSKITELQAKFDAQQDSVNKLNAQLRDLTQAKQTQEIEMLEKFRQLLNAKKVKIRDQQRLLASAKVDPKQGKQHGSLMVGLILMRDVQASQVRNARNGPGGHRSVALKGVKRKTRSMKFEPDDDGDEGLDPMQADRDKDAEPVSEDEIRPQTPDRSEEDETDDENELEMSSLQNMPKTIPLVTDLVTEGIAEEGRGKLKSPPPRRDLPFTSNDVNASTTKQSMPAIAADDTDDDEL